MHRNGGKRRAQVSIEFLMVIAFMIMAFSVYFAYLSERSLKYADIEKKSTAESIAHYVAETLDSALLVGDGFSRVVELPPTIKGEDYSINITNGLVIVSFNEYVVYSPTLVKSIVGTIKPGKNTISNVGGVIHVE